MFGRKNLQVRCAAAAKQRLLLQRLAHRMLQLWQRMLCMLVVLVLGLVRLAQLLELPQLLGRLARRLGLRLAQRLAHRLVLPPMCRRCTPTRVGPHRAAANASLLRWLASAGRLRWCAHWCSCE